MFKFKTLLILLILFSKSNCIGSVGSYFGKPIDYAREKILKKKNCNFEEIKNNLYYSPTKYSNLFKEYGGKGDMVLGLYGIYATYPNGLYMVFSFFYATLSGLVLHGERFGDKKEIEFRTSPEWLHSSQNEVCENVKNFYIHYEYFKIELNPSIQENTQLSKNTSKEILNQFCIDKTKEFDEKLFSKVEESVKKEYSYEKFYEKEWYYKKYKKKKNPNTKLNFKKYVLNSEFNVQSKLQKNSKYNFENKSVNHLSCELEYIVEYKYGSIQFFWDNFEEVK